MSSFVKRTVALNIEQDEFTQLPVVVRRGEIQQVFRFKQLFDRAKSSLQVHKENEFKKLAKLKVDTEKEAKVEGLGQVLAALEELKACQHDYFNSVEAHCATIVEAALKQILSDISYEERVKHVVRTVASHIKEKNGVCLKVHPDYCDLAEELVAARGWSISGDDGLAADECRIEVALGEYHSSFQQHFQLLFNTLEGQNSTSQD